MIERIIYDGLTAGVAHYRDTPGAISHAFQTPPLFLPPEEAAALETLFRNKQTPTVHMGYPRVDAVFPAYFITLGAESESKRFLGDDGGQILDREDPDFGADEYAAVFNYQFNLLVFAQHPDVVLAYYQLLKRMVIDYLPTLKSNGLFDISFSGADMAPDPSWVPAGLFVRRATLSCSREYTQAISSTRVGRAWKVQSIHIDAAGDPGADVGGVLTHVTVAEK